MEINKNAIDQVKIDNTVFFQYLKTLIVKIEVFAITNTKIYNLI